jgi:hypothetical protein
MKTKSASTPLTGSLMRIGGVVVPIVIAVFLVFNQANFLMGRALLIAFGHTETTYKSASLQWNGDVVAKDVVIHPFDVEEEDVAIRFEHVHLETPGWFWFLRNTFDRKLKRAQLDRLHLTLTGGQSNAGFEPSLGDLGPVGAVSASPFEAEGCSQDGMWLREELVEMGLKPEPTTLEFDYRVERGELLTTVVLETKGASRVQLDRVASLPGRTNMLLLDTYSDETRSERWEVQDQGFVAARNRFCAKKDKTDPLRIVDRHMESVERLMDTLGIGVDKASLAIYRRFARGGGKLIYSVSYPKALPGELLYELREHPGVIASSNASISHESASSTLRWQSFDPIPLPGLDEGEPTYAALLKERAEKLRETPADAAIATDASTAAVDAGNAAAPATPATLDLDALIAEKTAEKSAAKAAADRATQDPTDSTAAATTATEPPPATTTVVDAPVATDAPPAKAMRSGTRLQWDQLSGLQGRLIRIWTVHNPPRTVEILSGSGDALRVSARLGGGNAEYTIQRGAFLKASLVR